MLLKQLVHILVVCSVSWPNCFCLVLFYLFIGSTLKRLCLGKERSSSNYLIYFLTLCLSYSVHYFSFPLCLYVHLFFFLFIVSALENVAVLVEIVGAIQIVTLIYVFLLFCMAMCLHVLIAEICHCLHIKHFICLWLFMKVIYVIILWLLCWQNMCHIKVKLELYSQVLKTIGTIKVLKDVYRNIVSKVP